ncbi:MAG: type II toxin-antitoxin system VapC family toxin [Candidatus Thermoplasmatota archaeon]|nr:type II toxin-antitoxin system VapC family toxin [Candidatus Thermoplasmatota archaeon]
MHFTCPNCKRRVRSLESKIKICPDFKKCGYDERYANFKRLEKIYLVDANIIIHALNNDPHNGADCQEVLLRPDIATTDYVIAENKGSHDKDPGYVFKVKEISPDLKELKANRDKQPSQADLSIIQAAVDNPGVIGIISYDPDFYNVSAKGYIEGKSNYTRRIWVGTAKEFLKKWKR